MKATELRIGNYITDDFASESAYFAVKELKKKICYYGASFKATYKGLKPIPLTEEWLLKFGFDKHGSLKHQAFTKDDFIIRKELDFDYEHESRSKTLKYVHQLQNLYHALTGKELKLLEI